MYTQLVIHLYTHIHVQTCSVVVVAGVQPRYDVKQSTHLFIVQIWTQVCLQHSLGLLTVASQ